MRLIHVPTFVRALYCLGLAAVLAAGCVPNSSTPAMTGATPTSAPITPTAASTPAPTLPGCSEGGQGVFSPEDARCYLAGDAPSGVQLINEDTVILFADPASAVDWVGAAIIFHTPSLSQLVLDQFGDVNVPAAVFRNRAGLVALSSVIGDTELMAGLKRQIQGSWQTVPTDEPAVVMSVAWQDGPTTVFLVAVTGLAVDDDRFYCANETWTIGEDVIELASDCIAYVPGTPVNHVFIMQQPVKGAAVRPVQIALNGVASNVLQVHEGPPAQDAAIYEAVLRQLAGRVLVVRAETAPGFGDSTPAVAAAVDPALWQHYLLVNEVNGSLHYLFQNSTAYFVHSNAVIGRDYLPAGEPTTACAQFRRDYPGLGGVATVSQIGFNEDGTAALVHALLECGPTDREAAYFTLTGSGIDWQVTTTIDGPATLATSTPALTYEGEAKGCGDIFVYRANAANSEVITLYVDATAFTFSPESVVLDLAAHPETIVARIDIYSDSIQRLGENPYCNDVAPMAEPYSVWQAVSGAVTVTVSTDAQPGRCAGEPYQATILLEDVTFSLDEAAILLPSLAFTDVTVGWCAG